MSSPGNVYQIRKTIVNELECFGINYTSEQEIFKKLAKFDFESTHVHEENFKVSNTTTWIRKQVLISVSISSNIVKESILLCNFDLFHFIVAFTGPLETFVSKSMTQMKLWPLISRQPWRINCVACCRNSLNNKIDKNEWEDLTRIKETVRTKRVLTLSSCKQKKMSIDWTPGTFRTILQ